MSTWVTSAGSIGTYTKQRQFTFNFNATPSLGGRIVYEIVGSWPPGSFRIETLNVSPGVFVGLLTATPDYVSIDQTYEFVISATEVTLTGSTPNPRTFTVTVSNTVWKTQSYLGSYIENNALNIPLAAAPSIAGHRISYELINGSLPAGQTVNTPLTLTTVQLPAPSLIWIGRISGTPGQVKELTKSTFTVRALEYNGLNQLVSFRDRTFTIDISGTTIPTFVTPSGTSWTYYDSTWIETQIEYNNPDPDTQARITLAAGSLPPGLEITPQGLIRGYAAIPQTSQATYNFTLSVRSASGESLAAYSIIIDNQAYVPGFVGRDPTLLNNRPLYVTPNPVSEYNAYYLAGIDIGSFVTGNFFAFKFIGYDFDGDDLTYEILPVNAFDGTGLTFSTSNGWLTGDITQTTGPSVNTYSFTITVYKTSNPSLSSGSFPFTLTLVNDIDLRIVWDTDPDLGTIQNGDVSVKAVKATSLAGKNLEYRVVGNDFQTNLKTIMYTTSPAEFEAFGMTGGYIQSANGTSWSLNTQTQLTLQRFNTLSSVFNTQNNRRIVVGSTTSQTGFIATSTDGENWSYSIPISPVPTSLNSVAWNGSTGSPVYVAVGNSGIIMRSTDGITWTHSSSGTSQNLLGVYYSGFVWVAVGARGTVLTSYNGITWNATATDILNDLTSVTNTGANWVLVGNLGLIILGTNIFNSATWTQDSVFVEYDYKKVTSVGNTVVIVGTRGSILTSINNGTNWTTQASNTTNNLWNVISTTSPAAYYAVGDGGTVLTSTNLIDWTSPTLSKLPPYLRLESQGDISGRLAFESLSTVIPAGTQTVYEFNVQAYCVDPGFEEITSTQTFQLTTVQKFPLPYDNLYIKALVSESDREFVNSIVYDYDLIPESVVYRPDDPYFGRAKGIRYQHMFGVPSVASQDLYSDYIAAVTQNHYWRNIVLGPVRAAQARNAANEIVYEVVYSQVVDNLVNAQGQSISKQIYWPRTIFLNRLPYFTASTGLYDSLAYYDNNPSVKRFQTLGTSNTILALNNTLGLSVGMYMTGNNVQYSGSMPPQVITVYPGTPLDPFVGVEVDVPQTMLLPGNQILFSESADTSGASGTVRTLYPNSLYNMRQQIAASLGFLNDPSLLPLWMSGQQANGDVLGYTQAWVLCYVKPGYAQAIADNINNYMASQDRYLNQVDFEIDRFEVDRSQTYGFQGGTSTSPIWSSLPSPGVTTDNQDAYIYFPHKTILPVIGQQ